MASPAQLMQTISDATGLPLATIVDMDRRLLKGGLRTKGGRGLNAPQMTPLDAARLLTAVLVSPQSNTALEAVERYAQTRTDKARSSEGLFADTGIGELIALPARHGFVDALAALIASATDGELTDIKRGSADGAMPHIEIFAFTRAVRGRLRFSALPSGTIVSVEYALASSSRKTGIHANANYSGDLEQSRRVTECTILAIAATLGTGGQDE